MSTFAEIYHPPKACFIQWDAVNIHQTARTTISWQQAVRYLTLSVTSRYHKMTTVDRSSASHGFSTWWGAHIHHLSVLSEVYAPIMLKLHSDNAQATNGQSHHQEQVRYTAWRNSKINRSRNLLKSQISHTSRPANGSV